MPRYTRDDKRTPEERAQTAGFVVATDSFMSGWGLAPGVSYFAVPFRTYEEAQIVLDNMQARSEMKRARIVDAKYYPRLREGDHLSIRSMSECPRFYKKHGFCERA